MDRVFASEAKGGSSNLPGVSFVTNFKNAENHSFIQHSCKIREPPPCLSKPEARFSYPGRFTLPLPRVFFSALFTNSNHPLHAHA